MNYLNFFCVILNYFHPKTFWIGAVVARAPKEKIRKKKNRQGT